jgi:hypothetical protein
MNIIEYFEKTNGLGVLATSASDGTVDIAIYARPHIIDETTIAFIMRDKLTHKNLLTNPKAAYLYHEYKDGFHGKRLYLTMLSEETDSQKIESMRRKIKCENDQEKQFLVYFQIDRIRPLIGE